MIHSASRQALAVCRTRLDELLGERAASATWGIEDSKRLSEQLGSVADLLVHQPRLRRTLADAATNAESRGELVRSLFGGKIGAEALDVVATTASQRWSRTWDFADAIEILADDVLLASADAQGQLDAVEDELFRFERILADNSELVAAFDEASVPAARRLELLNSVLATKVNPITFELIAHAVTSSRKASLQLAIDDLLEASAVRRHRSVALVVSASELTDAQSARLGAALSQMYGRQISIRSAIDPQIRGGLEVRLGDEVIDGTIASRMSAARAALAH